MLTASRFAFALLVAGLVAALPPPPAAAPSIASITPPQGPITGVDVTIRGNGFDGAVVRLDAQAVTPAAQSDTEIRLRLPAHANGYVVISIRSASGIAYGEFLYVPPRLFDLPPGHITTVAGMGQFVRDYGRAIEATVAPAGLALDRDGTLYFGEPNYNKISRVRPDGTIERVTGPSGGPLNPGDPNGDGGPAIDAPVSFPLSIGLDPDGTLYVADQNSRIRRIDRQTGIITTIAGDGRHEYSGDDGPAIQARVSWPTHIAADRDDVFFLDFGASRIRRIQLATGLIATFAGNGTAGDSGDNGPGPLAQFNTGDPDSGHLALDPSGHLYLADTENFKIRRIDRRSGVITTFYVLPRSGGARDFIGRVRSIAFDAEGNLYCGGGSRIIKIDSRGAFVTSWGIGMYTMPVEGSFATTSGLGLVTGLAIDDRNIYFTDESVRRVRRIELSSGRLYTVAGIGPSIVGENGPATATVVQPYDLAADRDGNILIAETGRVRRLDRNGTITTIAGTGSQVGLRAPAPALSAVAGGKGIDVNADGEIETTAESVVSRIDRAGILSHIVGRSGACGYAGDGGPATSGTLCQAWDSVRDRDGNLFIADTNNNRIRRVDARTGVISTVVGNGGPPGGFERYNSGTSCGDGGPAIQACINTPYGVAVDGFGNLFLSERPGIRKVDPAGTITTFAAIPNTTKLIFDGAGNLYAGVVAGLFTLDRSGRQTWIVGGGGSSTQAGFAGDGGPALQAKVNISNQAAGMAIDGEGNLYFVDSGRVRAVRLGAAAAASDRGANRNR
jgi:sugar lactone lactonase YvrE